MKLTHEEQERLTFAIELDNHRMRRAFLERMGMTYLTDEQIKHLTWPERAAHDVESVRNGFAMWGRTLGPTPPKPMISLGADEVLLLKSVRPDRYAYNQNGRVVQYPESGMFQPMGSMHAFLWGTSDRLSDLFPYSDSSFIRYGALFLVIKAPKAEVHPIDGHVIVYGWTSCEVVYCGDKETALALLSEHAPVNTIWHPEWYEKFSS